MTFLVAEQHSALNRFDFRLHEAGSDVGTIGWPMVAQATNARLRWHANATDGCPRIRLGAVEYTVRVEYLTRGFNNSARFSLHDPAGLVHAEATQLVQPGFAGRPIVTLESPVSLRFVPRWRWFRSHVDLAHNGLYVGAIFEPRLLSMRRVLHCELTIPLALPARALLLYRTVQRISGG